MANCDYCNDTNLVAGPNDPPHYVIACSYCEPSVTPLTRIKPQPSPFKGALMPVPDYVPGKDNGYAVWAEPDVVGERCVVILPSHSRKLLAWTEGGRVTMHKTISSALSDLAEALAFEGWDEWAVGAMFEIILPANGDRPMVYHAMPLIHLLDGHDPIILGLRRNTLEKDWVPTAAIQLMPRVTITTRPTIDEEVLRRIAIKFGVDNLMIKQSHGSWGREPCWSRYNIDGPDEDF